MSAKFDHSRIMKEAHFMARWRVNTVGGSYRAWFAKTLAAEWRKAKERAERRSWNASSRMESNLGLPLRSCPADAAQQMRLSRELTKPTEGAFGSFVSSWGERFPDAAPRSGVFAGVVPAARLFTRTSGRVAGSFAA